MERQLHGALAGCELRRATRPIPYGWLQRLGPFFSTVYPLYGFESQVVDPPIRRFGLTGRRGENMPSLGEEALREFEMLVKEVQKEAIKRAIGKRSWHQGKLA